jgi:hypothetical protein
VESLDLKTLKWTRLKDLPTSVRDVSMIYILNHVWMFNPLWGDILSFNKSDLTFRIDAKRYDNGLFEWGTYRQVAVAVPNDALHCECKEDRCFKHDWFG